MDLQASTKIYDILLSADAPNRVVNKTVRRLVEQMEAHGWQLAGQDAMLCLTRWEAPDGRTLRIQFLDSTKPQVSIRDRFNPRQVTYKVAMAHVVTPTLPEVDCPSISQAMENLGQPTLNGTSWSDPGPGAHDLSLRPLVDAQKVMVYTGTDADPDNAKRAAAVLRVAAARNRETVARFAEFNQTHGYPEGWGVGNQAQRANEFEAVAVELERMQVEYAEYVAERDRRADLPLDIRPGRPVPRPATV